MKIQRIITFVALLLPALLSAEFNYYGYFVVGSGTMTQPEGESLLDPLKDKKPFEILSFAFRGENTVNIGDTHGTPVSGTVNFDRLEMLIQTDSKAVLGLTKAMVTGGLSDQFFIEGWVDQGSGNSRIGVKLSLLLVAVSEVELEGTQGDRGVIRIVLDWGAMKLETYSVDPKTGESKLNGEATWSRVNNDIAFEI